MQVGLCAAALVLTLAGNAQAACPPDSRIEEWVFGAGHCLAVSTFGVEAAGTSPTLIVVVHGDISDGGLATYHVEFARSLARPGIIAVALTRPGYADPAGRLSQGSAFGRIDNYTATNVAAVGAAVTALKRHYGAGRLIYVGHSGGAAIGGVLIARWPGIVDAAVLVSCPCDVARWRRERWNDAWRRSLSPSDHVGRVPRATRVIALTGSADPNTSPLIAQRYVRTLVRRGIEARFVAVEGAGHGFSGLADAAARIVNDLMAARRARIRAYIRPALSRRGRRSEWTRSPPISSRSWTGFCSGSACSPSIWAQSRPAPSSARLAGRAPRG